ncbi:MAG TPA: GNAT family N-acetyltransferase [Bryobacteraceae bacterium]|jgi:GNAT superfamily N-acetyltransferase|nr:GNAT family N-acetyltransferase [Bryobacteraceae bacterium]
MNIFRETDKLNGCPALPLAVEAWGELLRDGLTGDAVILQWDQSVVWVEQDGVPVAVILWAYQEYRREIWIGLSYTRPEVRGNGLFRTLYQRIVAIAKEKKAIRIAGGVNVGNAIMREAAERCGRKADYIVYSQAVEQSCG